MCKTHDQKPHQTPSGDDHIGPGWDHKLLQHPAQHPKNPTPTHFTKFSKQHQNREEKKNKKKKSTKDKQKESNLGISGSNDSGIGEFRGKAKEEAAQSLVAVEAAVVGPNSGGGGETTTSRRLIRRCNGAAKDGFGWLGLENLELGTP